MSVGLARSCAQARSLALRGSSLVERLNQSPAGAGKFERVLGTLSRANKPRFTELSDGCRRPPRTANGQRA